MVADGNYDETRKPIDRIIIHTTVGTVNGAIARFSTIGTIVSAHYIISLDGKIYHGLEETFTAYHAGDYAMNQRSIGIEHEDGGDYNGVRPDILYKTSASLVADICKFYSIPADRQHILKHSEVHPTGCPDALDIDRIVREASVIVTPTPSPPVLIPPNPGYMPTFVGQTVSKDGITYQSYADTNGTLLWKIQQPVPPTPTPPPVTPPPAPAPSPPPTPVQPTDCCGKLRQVHDTLYGGGFWWNKYWAIQKLIPK